jgi:Spy/CpxP family protein refolding chaperone
MMKHWTTSRLARLVVVGACAVASVSPLAAQGGREGPRQAPGSEARGADAAGVTPGEIQRMFDAYALLQAQEQLKISDDQFSRFLTRFKALQQVRRQTLQERGRLIASLRPLANAPQPDEAQIKERLTALQDLEARSAVDLKKAYDAIDQLLDIRQQAKFRVFEEMMERRKLELVMRARQRKQPKL